MFRISLSGALGADAEVREVGNRKAINFSVAVNKFYKNSDGSKVEKTEWIKATAWRSSENVKVAEFLKKGKKVMIEGEPGVDAFVGKDGQAVGHLTVNVSEIDFLS